MILDDKLLYYEDYLSNNTLTVLPDMLPSQEVIGYLGGKTLTLNFQFYDKDVQFAGPQWFYGGIWYAKTPSDVFSYTQSNFTTTFATWTYSAPDKLSGIYFRLPLQLEREMLRAFPYLGFFFAFRYSSTRRVKKIWLTADDMAVQSKIIGKSNDSL